MFLKFDGADRLEPRLRRVAIEKREVAPNGRMTRIVKDSAGVGRMLHESLAVLPRNLITTREETCVSAQVHEFIVP